MKTEIAMTIAVFGYVAATMGNAWADDSAYRHEQTASSLESALGGRTVALLKAKRPKGGSQRRFAAIEALLAEYAGSLTIAARDSDSIVARSVDGSYLEVDRDASSFRFHLSPDHATSLSSSVRMGNAEIESRGRAILEGVLAELYTAVPESAPGLQAVFLGSRYLVEDTGSVETGEVEERVVANIAVFGREVDGVPVVGPGSKIAVFLSGQGGLIGLDVDWPEYKVLRKKQITLGIDQVRARFAEHANEQIPFPGANVESGMELQRFECGYVDLGARKRKGAKIQAGCFAQVTGRSSGGEFRQAFSEVMPIGTRPEKDKRWPVTSLIRGRAVDLCKATEHSCEEPGPVPDHPAPFFVTTMTHMEGNWGDHLGTAGEPLFERHAEQLRMGATIASLNEATLTVESELPFSVAQILYGDNVLQDMLDRGHGVGTHCDIQPRTPVPETFDYAAELEALTGAVTATEAVDIGFATSMTPMVLSDLASGASSADEFREELRDFYQSAFRATNGIPPAATLDAVQQMILDLVAEWRIRKVMVDVLVGVGENLGCSGGGGFHDWVQGAQIAGFNYVDGIVGYHYLSMPLENRPYGWDDAAILSSLYHEAAPVDLTERLRPVFLANGFDFDEDPDGDVLMSGGSLGRLDGLDGDASSLSEDDIEEAMRSLALSVAAHDSERVGKATFYLPAALFVDANIHLLTDFFGRIYAEFVVPGHVSWASQREVHDAVVAWNAAHPVSP